MRGLLPELPSPHPLAPALPAIFQEDDLAQRLMAAFDEVLAPVLSSLDNIEAYHDPRFAPDDFLDWLGGWVGLVLDESWPVERRRTFVARAVELYQRRGTVEGLRAHVEIVTGGEVEVTDSGGSAWSPVTGAVMPGTPVFTLGVRVRVADPRSVDLSALDAFIEAAKPAHVAHSVEVVGRAG